MRLFEPTGAHVLVDGQFGSTGKGALASFLASQAVRSKAARRFLGVVSSAGPNSGHTSYFGQMKIVLKQLPTFAVHTHLNGFTLPVYLSAGAVIDPDVLRAEALKYKNIPIFVHQNAAVVAEKDREAEQDGTVAAVASTQSGTGAAIARKVLRDPEAIARNSLKDMPPNVNLYYYPLPTKDWAYFFEVSQGFSLGLNSKFYPHVTSRECTAMQAIADARVPPNHVTKVYACFRTFPIRVGNLGDHSSGGWYPDQEETTWEKIGVEPEFTTVTNRQRRVATFSFTQFMHAIMANEPDWIAVNFLNYLEKREQEELLFQMKRYVKEARLQCGFILGHGPYVGNWTFEEDHNAHMLYP